MEENNLQKIVKNKEFIFGLAIGIAVISTVALVGLVAYIMTGGRAACLAQCEGDASNGKVAKKFEQCLDSGKYDSKIDQEQALGLQLGVQGTPATFINGYLVSGALPYEMIKPVIDQLLAGQEPDADFLKDEEGNIMKIDMPQITDDDHQTGAKNGKITIVKFSDFECPYCARFRPTMQKILDEYPNEVTYVFKHFPLSFHQYAKTAAVASECAAEQGKFWEMYDELFDLNENQTLNAENIKKAAVEIGLK